MNRIETNVHTLAHDLCEGFEDKYNEEKVVQALNKAMETEGYTIEQLWEMNNNDSGDVYDILADYYQFDSPIEKTIIYKNVNEGDWVVCSNCGKKMLVPYGADQCPECTMDGVLAWAHGQDYAEVNTDIFEALGEEMEFVDRELNPEDYLSPELLQETMPDHYHDLLGHYHNCNICGKRMKWDDNIWVNSSFGICEECYDKMPKDINQKLQDEEYDKTVYEYLNDVGAIY